ncbi:hypothetical protein PSTG_20152, partial [Puccinia striiformis f. sp. tritici PST-78]
MMIRAVDSRYGGACHDSHIWNLSVERLKLKQRYEAGDTAIRILGDSGYPLEPWLLTPYKNTTQNSPESLFNSQFTKARCCVENVFGVLKGRFRCLLAARELHYSPSKASLITNVCCALHNICVLHKVEMPPMPDLQDENDYDSVPN